MDSPKTVLPDLATRLRFLADCGPNMNDVARDLLREGADEVQRLHAIIDTPDPHDFWEASKVEAQFQQARWGNGGDAGKADADWFWLIGYLGGKVLYAQTTEKKLHRITTIAAAARNWHAAVLGDHSMRPGIAEPKA